MKPTHQQNNTVVVTENNFNEMAYLQSNPDVAKAVKENQISSGKKHFKMFGRNEGLTMCIPSKKTTQSYSRFFKVLRKIIPQPLKNEIKAFIANQNPSGNSASHQIPIQATQAQPDDNTIFMQQLMSILHHELNIPLPPPKHLQIRVVGGYSPDFMESGFSSIYPTLNRVLKPTGKELKSFHSILDFGCGCGRAIRALATLLPESKLYGTDIDDEAIKWLQLNYSKFAEFTAAPHFPPTIYENQQFDLVFGISVFTHLPEEMQFQWLKELSRITKDDGYIILTTHGEKHYKDLTPDVVDIMNKKGFYYSDFGVNYGKSISLPDFYQTRFHSHDYIRREWGKYFDVIDIQTLGIDNHQDTILLRNRKLKKMKS
jgi:SAM-dependent methyltransferase